MRGLRGTVPGSWRRRLPVVLAAGLLVLGVVGAAVRLDAAADGSSLPFGAATWRTRAVVVDVPSPADGGLRTGDEVRAIAGPRSPRGWGRCRNRRRATSCATTSPTASRARSG